MSIASGNLAVVSLTVLSVAVLVIAHFAGLIGQGRGRRRRLRQLRYWRASIAGLMVLGMALWLGLLSAIVAHRTGDNSPATQPSSSGVLEQLSPSVAAMAATIPATVGFLALLIGGAVVVPGFFSRLGLRAAGLPRGLWTGLIGLLLALPLVQWMALLAQTFYDLVSYQHPSEHEILRILEQAKEGGESGTYWALILGAVIVAPVFEELLFRGYLQTLLTNLLTPRRIRPIDSPPPPPASWSLVPAWAAILLTSAVFAYFHGWEAPMIFVLSICLGWAYERTGNLWTAIIMHALFNGISTALFITVQMAHA